MSQLKVILTVTGFVKSDSYCRITFMTSSVAPAGAVPQVLGSKIGMITKLDDVPDGGVTTVAIAYCVAAAPRLLVTSTVIASPRAEGALSVSV